MSTGMIPVIEKAIVSLIEQIFPLPSGDGLGLSSHREGEVQVQSGADTQRYVLLCQLGET